MNTLKIALASFTFLAASTASAETFTCSYEFNPESPNLSWTTSYRDGDSYSFARALYACERDGGTAIISNDSP